LNQPGSSDLYHVPNKVQKLTLLYFLQGLKYPM